MTNTSTDSRGPRIEWTGARYGVTWHRGTEQQFVHLDSSGNTLHTPIVLHPGSCPGSYGRSFPVWNGSGWMFVWHDCDLGEIAYVRVGCDCVDGDGDAETSCRDCDDLIDEDENGVDSDGDTVANLCDNCPATPNLPQDDTDLDHVGDDCDNCVLDKNPSQSDLDDDEEGDRCDNDDAYVYLYFDLADWVDWDNETGFDDWNCYRGDLDVLIATGVYTQADGSNPLVGRLCGTGIPAMADPVTPPPSKVAFYISAGLVGTVEGSLGAGIGGAERPNDNPCP